MALKTKEETEETKNAPIKADDIMQDLQLYIRKTYGVDVDKNKTRGLAFETLRGKGEISNQDKYASYEHVLLIQETLNSAFDGIFEFRDVEHLTGNLMFGMKLGTRKPIEDVERLVNLYKEKYLNEHSGKLEIDVKQFDTDMLFVISQIKKSMSDTWQYLEQTQIRGIGILISKILKFIINKKNG